MSAQLTPRQSQLVQQILQSLDQTSTTPASNRRQRNRVNFQLNLEATLLSSPALPQIPIHTRNLSSSGLAFVCRREFRANEMVAIHLTITNNPLRLILAKTVFCRYLRAGHYEVGVEFQEAAKAGRIRIPTAWVQPREGHHGGGIPTVEPIAQN